MRNFQYHGMLVAATALLIASGSAAYAADPDIERLIETLQKQNENQQKQIDALSQELHQMKQAQPAAAASADAPKIPQNNGPGFTQFGSSAGGFVIPGTKTALKVGGNIQFQVAFDKDAGAGAASGDSYGIRAGNLTGGSGFALPGTPAARQQGRLTMNTAYSRLTFETRTPTEYGNARMYMELDNGASASGGDQWGSNKHTVGVRLAYGQLGNFTLGQAKSTWSDDASNVISVLNNGAEGPQAALRQPLAQYRWDVDLAQKNQVYVAAENPFSDFLGADKESFSGVGLNAPTNFTAKYPDFLLKYAHNETWGRTWLTGLVRDLNINTVGVPLGASAGSRYTGTANDSAIAWGVGQGTKIYPGWLDPKDSFVYRLEFGQGIGRYMQSTSLAQNPSAVVDTTGHLKTIFSAGYLVGYQHFWTPSHTWQTNVNWSDARYWQKNSLMSYNCSTGGSVCGESGLPLDVQTFELNAYWSPNSFVSIGPAYVYTTTRVAKGLNLAGVAGATHTTSGTTAADSRFILTTNIGF